MDGEGNMAEGRTGGPAAPLTCFGLQVELAVLGSADEGVPLRLREDQRRSAGVLRVANRDCGADKGDFNAVVAVGAACRALAPDGPAQVDPEPLGLDFHHSSFARAAM